MPWSSSDDRAHRRHPIVLGALGRCAGDLRGAGPADVRRARLVVVVRASRSRSARAGAPVESSPDARELLAGTSRPVAANAAAAGSWPLAARSRRVVRASATSVSPRSSATDYLISL